MHATGVYLKTPKWEAVFDFVARRAGSMEVPQSFAVPTWRELPDTMPRHPCMHDKYYVDGGTNWPARVIVSDLASPN